MRASFHGRVVGCKLRAFDLLRGSMALSSILVYRSMVIDPFSILFYRKFKNEGWSLLYALHTYVYIYIYLKREILKGWVNERERERERVCVCVCVSECSREMGREEKVSDIYGIKRNKFWPIQRQNDHFTLVFVGLNCNFCSNQKSHFLIRWGFYSNVTMGEYRKFLKWWKCRNFLRGILT